LLFLVNLTVFRHIAQVVINTYLQFFVIFKTQYVLDKFSVPSQ